MILKKILPQSLFERFLLIITIPSIIVQIVAIYVFYYTHIDAVNKHMARSIISEMLFIKNSIDSEVDTKLIKEFSKNIRLINFSFSSQKKLRKKAKIVNDKKVASLGYFDFAPILDPLNRFKMEMKGQGLTPFGIYKNRDDNFLTVMVEVKNGTISFYVPKKRISSSTEAIFTIWMVTTSLLMSLIAVLFLKNQIKSIKELSIVAEKFGKGDYGIDFKPSGAEEIRSVGITFIKMKERIIRQINQRTDMLSGVSHDLRTPLTRMKLQLEMIPDSEATQELRLDIADMEKMINDYLAFAGDLEEEKSENIKVKFFLRAIISYYKKINHEINYNFNFPDNLELKIKPDYLKRAIRNLIDNGFKYGSKVEILADISDKNLRIIIDDNGPGIPKNERENVFKPFYRLDNSRNLDISSTGLGLAIVLDSVTSHGGRIEIDDNLLGGLRVIINLPI